MAHALAPPPTEHPPSRFISLGVSVLLWGAALVGLGSLGARVLPPPRVPAEPPPITVVAPPRPPVAGPPPRVTPRTTPAPSPIAVIAPPPAPLADVAPAPGPAAVADPAPGPALVTHPVWLHRPTPADVARFYPPRAIARNREGTASLDCLVGADGRLACTVVAEDPLGWGFGAAALQLARAYQMQPATRDGVPVEARYMLRVPFQLN